MKDIIDMKLAEGYRLWDESGIPMPLESERNMAVNELAHLYNGPYAPDLAAACQCFSFFRKLHGMTGVSPTWATLLGDYFFSQFSKNIIPIDSVLLNDAFSHYLKNDIRSPGDDISYTAFIRTLPAVLK